MTSPIILSGTAPVLIVADHASNRVPEGLDLGIDAALLDTHIAIDIGTAALAQKLAETLDAPAVLADICRLVIDLNREPDAPGLIPVLSDGHAIPANHELDATERQRRLDAYHTPYHAAIATILDARSIELVVAVHSFTPQLASRPDERRPWQIGVLHNTDSRAAKIAISHLREQELVVGDNQPYSGRKLNHTMNHHAEARGLPYLGFEIRQDLLETSDDITRWRNILAQTVRHTLFLLRAA